MTQGEMASRETRLMSWSTTCAWRPRAVAVRKFCCKVKLIVFMISNAFLRTPSRTWRDGLPRDDADVLAGAYLSKEAKSTNVVYSMAYGDQPALTIEIIEWARASGFNVTAAGKGTKYLPEFHASTPDTVWNYYGLNKEEAEIAGMNPKMFNSFFVCFNSFYTIYSKSFS